MSGGVAADGAVGQRGRAEGVVHAAAVKLAELPLTVQLLSVAVPEELDRPPYAGVAADGAVAQRGRAVVGQAAAVAVAELPLTVQLVSVAMPEFVQSAAAL